MKKYIKELKIGNIKLNNNILVAPMAGITDRVYREILNEYGKPGAIGIEMVSAKGVFYNDEKTLKMIENYEGEYPRIIQIFGSELESMKYAVKKLSKYADIIDINAGCPMLKVKKTGSGAALMENLENLELILSEIVKISDIPITLKTRIGYENNIVIDEILEICHRTGVSALSIHGRFTEQIYSGKVYFDIIKRIKEKAKIPIIANGGIFTIEDAKLMFEKTNADGIMLARGVIGNPFLTREILENKKLQISKEEKLEMLKKHYYLLKENIGETRASKEIRKFVSYYTKGLDNASYVRSKLSEIIDNESFLELLSTLDK